MKSLNLFLNFLIFISFLFHYNERIKVNMLFFMSSYCKFLFNVTQNLDYQKVIPVMVAFFFLPVSKQLLLLTALARHVILP